MSMCGGARRGFASGFISVLLTGTALAMVPAPVWAQERAETAQAATRYQFNIPAGPLASALAQFGQQSGRQVTANTDSIRGVSTAGVQGNLTVDEAMQRLLSGTGAVYSVGAGSVISVQRPGSTTSNAMQLDPVQVQGVAVPPQAEIGNLPRAFAGGQVAKGSYIGLLGNKDYMDTPYSVTTYTRETISNQQALTLKDAVAADPTVLSPTGPGALGVDDRLIIRGFTMTPRTMAFNGLFNAGPEYVLGMAGVERVEIFRGPTAMLFGMGVQGNVGGLVNLIPKRAPTEGIRQATVRYISDTQFGGHVDFGERFGPDKSFGLRANVAYTGGAGPVYAQTNNLGEFTLGADYKGENFRLDADFGYMNAKTYAPQWGMIPSAAFPVPAAPSAYINREEPWSYMRRQDIYGMVRAEYDFLPGLTGFAKFGARHSDYSQSGSLDFLGNNGAFTSVQIPNTGYWDSLSAELGVRANFTTGALKHDFAFSGNYSLKGSSSITSAGAALPASNIYAPIYGTIGSVTNAPQPGFLTQKSLWMGLGIADSVSMFDDRLQLIGGLRLQNSAQSNYSAATGLTTAATPGSNVTAITPTVGLVVRPWKEVSFYGNFIQALEQGPVAPAGTINVGTAFPAIMSKQFEIGAKLDVEKFGATLSVFQITKPLGITNPGGVFGINGSQQNTGFEFLMFGEPLPGFRPLGGITSMTSIQQNTAGGLTNGKYTPGVPTFQANLGFDWDVPPVKGLTVGGRMVYLGPVYVDTANQFLAPAWTRFDLSAKYTFERKDGKPVSLRANVYNVGNANYWNSADGLLTTGAPRTFLLSLTADF